jgi:hypothetical protein
MELIVFLVFNPYAVNRLGSNISRLTDGLQEREDAQLRKAE